MEKLLALFQLISIRPEKSVYETFFSLYWSVSNRHFLNTKEAIFLLNLYKVFSCYVNHLCTIKNNRPKNCSFLWWRLKNVLLKLLLPSVHKMKLLFFQLIVVTTQKHVVIIFRWRTWNWLQTVRHFLISRFTCLTSVKIIK